MTPSPRVLLRIAWMAAAVGVAFCSVGCEDHPAKGTYTRILPDEEDDALVNGQCDAARIAYIIVYMDILWPDYVEDLEKCRRIVKIVGEPAISEFVRSLTPEADKDLGEPARFPRVSISGVFEVVLKDGRSLYLGYCAQEDSQHVRGPSADQQWEGPGHMRKAWRVWMLRYVYDTGGIRKSAESATPP